MSKEKPNSAVVKGPGVKPHRTRTIWATDTKITCSHGTFIKNADTGVFEWVINEKVYLDFTDASVK